MKKKEKKILKAFKEATTFKSKKEEEDFNTMALHLRIVMKITDIQATMCIKNRFIYKELGISKKKWKKYLKADIYFDLKTIAKIEKILNLKLIKNDRRRDK